MVGKASSSAPSSWKSSRMRQARSISRRPGEGLRGESPVGLVRHLGGAPDRVQLARVLDRAKLLDPAGVGNERGAARAELLEARDRDGLGLEGDLSLEQPGQSPEKVAPDLDHLDAGQRRAAAV